MKWICAVIILKEIFKSLNTYEQLPNGASEFIDRLLTDLHYGDRKIKATDLVHHMKYKSNLFEDDILKKIKEEND